MNLNEALSLLPEGSPLRASILGLHDRDSDIRERTRALLPWQRDLTESEADALLGIATRLVFPPIRMDWSDSASELIKSICRNPYPSLIPKAEAAYPEANDDAKKGLLAYFGATGSREGAESLVRCVRDHGWPDGFYAPMFDEMEKLSEHSDILFPELLLLAGPFIVDVGNVAITALETGKLRAEQLRPIQPLLIENLSRYLALAEPYQEGTGVAWRFSERYHRPRHHAGIFLDFAGWLPEDATGQLIERALKMRDPRLLVFAARSRIRHRGSAPPEILDQIAACHETRAMLLEMLESVGRAHLFPQFWRTWDAFAAAAFVFWLCYPTELAREPDELEKMAVYTCIEEGSTQAVYLWRFKADGQWYSGTSGPHPIDDEPHYATGIHTFGFDEWEQSAIVEYLAQLKQESDEWTLSWSASNTAC